MGNIIAAETPVICVEVFTSGPTLSKSGNPPFTITLKAHTDTDKPVTIDTFNTIFDSRKALDQYGLTFSDTASGVLAQRLHIDILYQVPDTLTRTIDSSDTAEIPPKDSPQRFTVSYTFRTPGSAPSSPPRLSTGGSTDEDIQARQAAMGAAIDRMLPELMSQVEGFTVGRTYEIGFGERTIAGYAGGRNLGPRADVFAYGPLGRSTHPKASEISLKLINRAGFEIVE